MTTDPSTLELDLRQMRLWAWVDHRGALILLTDYTTERELTDDEIDQLGAIIDAARAKRR